MFDTADYDPESLFDNRTGALRLGSRIRGTTNVRDVLTACVCDFRCVLDNTEGDGEEYDYLTKTEGLIEMLDDPSLQGLPQLDDYAARWAREMFDTLSNATPAFTFYGPHRTDATDFGVWIQWDKIDDEIASGAITAINTESDYLLVGGRLYDARTAGIPDPATSNDIIASGMWVIEDVAVASRMLLVERPDGKAILYALPDALIWETSDE